MNSNIANDLDAILNVLASHFAPAHRAGLDTPSKIVVYGMGALAIVFIAWMMAKMAATSPAYKNQFSDKRFIEAQALKMIARENYERARYEAALDEIDAKYDAVVNGAQIRPVYEAPTAQPSYRVNGKYGSGFVYLIKSGGRYKIGLAANPQKRLTDLQTSAPDKMELIHTIKTDNMREAERKLHRQYRAKRVHLEWFELSADDVETICKIEEMNHMQVAEMN